MKIRITEKDGSAYEGRCQNTVAVVSILNQQQAAIYVYCNTIVRRLKSFYRR